MVSDPLSGPRYHPRIPKIPGDGEQFTCMTYCLGNPSSSCSFRAPPRNPGEALPPPPDSSLSAPVGSPLRGKVVLRTLGGIRALPAPLPLVVMLVRISPQQTVQRATEVAPIPSGSAGRSVAPVPRSVGGCAASRLPADARRPAPSRGARSGSVEHWYPAGTAAVPVIQHGGQPDRRRAAATLPARCSDRFSTPRSGSGGASQRTLAPRNGPADGRCVFSTRFMREACNERATFVR